MSVDIKDALSRSLLFGDFPSDELDKIAQIAHEHQLSPGTELFRSGDSGEELFVLAMGTVRVLKAGARGDLEEIAVLGSGSHFGEMALVNKEHRRSATVEAQELSHLVGVKQSDLEKLCQSDQALGHHFYKTLSVNLARRLSNTSDDAAHFKSMALKRRG